MWFENSLVVSEGYHGNLYLYIGFKMCTLLNFANKMQVFTLQLKEYKNGNMGMTLSFFFLFRYGRLDLCPYVCSVLKQSTS